MRHAGPTRREIGVRTAFNLLGPITNPAGARRQLLGVGDPAAAARLATVLAALGVERAFVVHGDRLDELPLDGSGVLYDVSPDGVRQRTITPRRAGLPRASTDQLTGGSPAENAALTESILHGVEGPRRDVVLLNAGAALEVAGRVDSLRDGIELAAATIDSGAAAALLERLRERRRGVRGAPGRTSDVREAQAARA
jgi:anthranilate phosphoribosyltransferase